MLSPPRQRALEASSQGVAWQLPWQSSRCCCSLFWSSQQALHGDGGHTPFDKAPSNYGMCRVQPFAHYSKADSAALHVAGVLHSVKFKLSKSSNAGIAPLRTQCAHLGVQGFAPVICFCMDRAPALPVQGSYTLSSLRRPRCSSVWTSSRPRGCTITGPSTLMLRPGPHESRPLAAAPSNMPSSLR